MPYIPTVRTANASTGAPADYRQTLTVDALRAYSIGSCRLYSGLPEKGDIVRIDKLNWKYRPALWAGEIINRLKEAEGCHAEVIEANRGFMGDWALVCITEGPMQGVELSVNLMEITIMERSE